MVWIPIPGIDFPLKGPEESRPEEQTGRQASSPEPEGEIANSLEETEKVLADAITGKLAAPCRLPVKREYRHLFGSDKIWLCPNSESARSLGGSIPAYTIEELQERLLSSPAAVPSSPGRQPYLAPATGREQDMPVSTQDATPATSWLTWLENIEVTVVSSLSEWEKAIAEAKAANVCGLDVETTSLDPLTGRLRLIQLAFLTSPKSKEKFLSQEWGYISTNVSIVANAPQSLEIPSFFRDTFEKSNVANVARPTNIKPGKPCGATVSGNEASNFDCGTDVARNFIAGHACRVYIADCFALGQREVAEALAGLLADPGVIKIGHNLKFDLAFIRQAIGRRLPMQGLFDTMLASQLNFAGYYKLEKAEKATKYELKEVYPAHSLADLVERHLGLKLDKTEQTGDWTRSLTPEKLKYATRDAAVLLPLWEIQNELLRRNGLERAARLEFDCLPAVVEIELAGMPFDAAEARRLLEAKQAALKEKEAVLIAQAEAAGFVPRAKKSQGKKTRPRFNPASTGDILNCLKLLGHDVADTRDETLQDLVQAGCDFAKTLLEYRATAKQVNFLKEWLDKQHPADDRLHASYRQLNHNSTGRFSCSNPNLQQVPSRGEDGKVFRRLFKAPAGRKLIKADLSGIELRIMAFLAGDTTMIEAFKTGADLHRLTAAAIAGKPPEEISKAERQAAKAVNFGLIYGCGPGRLMESAKYEYGVNMSQEEAVKARDAFFSAYPGIAAWHKRQKNLRYHPEPHCFHLAGKGYFDMSLVAVRTASGRKRVWPNYGGKTAATITRLFNTPDQGTGADVLKAAMAIFYEVLLKAGWEDVKLVACVHDELVAEAPGDLAEEVAGRLVAALETAGAEFISPVPVTAEVVIADTWSG